MSQTNSRLQGGGLILPQGSSPGGIAVGEKALIVDVDGSVKVQDAAGNKTPVGGTGDAWADAQITQMLIDCPTLNRFEYIKPGQNPLGVLFAFNAAAGNTTAATIMAEGTAFEGGSMGVASDTLFGRLSTVIYTAPRTKPMAVAFRAKWPAIAAAKTSTIGLCVQAANGGILTFGWDHGTSATNWYFSVSGTGALVTSVAADTLPHTLLISSNPTTPLTRALLDGTELKNSANVATLTNSPCGIGIFSSASITPGVQVGRVLYGYEDPLV